MKIGVNHAHRADSLNFLNSLGWGSISYIYNHLSSGQFEQRPWILFQKIIYHDSGHGKKPRKL